MLKKLSLLTLVALMGIVASGTVVYAADKPTIDIKFTNISDPYNMDHYYPENSTLQGSVTITGLKPTRDYILQISGYLINLSKVEKFTATSGSGSWGFSGKLQKVMTSTGKVSGWVTAKLYDGSGNYINKATLNFDLFFMANVWPGDANNDGVVDTRDVINIGLYWHCTGPKRPGASTNWREQQVDIKIGNQKWSPAIAAYADTNGDGIVNAADVLAIGENWKKKH